MAKADKKSLAAKIKDGDFEGFFAELAKSKVAITSTILGGLMIVQEYQELFPEKLVHWSGVAIALMLVLFRAHTQAELSQTRNALKKTRPEAKGAAAKELAAAVAAAESAPVEESAPKGDDGAASADADKATDK